MPNPESRSETTDTIVAVRDVKCWRQTSSITNKDTIPRNNPFNVNERIITTSNPSGANIHSLKRAKCPKSVRMYGEFGKKSNQRNAGIQTSFHAAIGRFVCETSHAQISGIQAKKRFHSKNA